MKKLFAALILLITLVTLAGCQGARKNTVRFNPDKDGKTETAAEASETKTTVEPITDKEAKEPITATATSAAVKDPGSLTVTLKEKEFETAGPYHVIRGTAPRNAYKIMVNDYTLQKYHPGQTRWSFIASSFGKTLKPGENTYKVAAVAKSGDILGTDTFKITYKPVASKLPADGASMNAMLMLSALLSGAYCTLRRKTAHDLA